jgi:hypothetical protein
MLFTYATSHTKSKGLSIGGPLASNLRFLHVQRCIQKARGPLAYVSKSFKETPKKVFDNDYIQRTSRSMIWRELDYHLIIHSFVVLALGPKHNTLFLLTAT